LIFTSQQFKNGVKVDARCFFCGNKNENRLKGIALDAAKKTLRHQPMKHSTRVKDRTVRNQSEMNDVLLRAQNVAERKKKSKTNSFY
jgi:hypothetical protein